MTNREAERHTALRLSAQRALLGAIHPEVRLIKVNWVGDRIEFQAICAEVSDEIAGDLSVAATEILADFPQARIRESILASDAPLPKENVIERGWVYLRAE